MADRVLNVFLHDRLAGVLLRKDNGNLQFRYDGHYVEAEGQPLSWNMPLQTGAFPRRECLAFFGNLLPEEDVRSQIALTTGISASNDYRLLERFGGDVAGAVTLLPPEESPEGPGPDELGRPTTHILKPEPERFPGLVANEFFCMRLAAATGLQVAEVDRAETLSGLPYLIVTRYDRDLTQEPVRRLHQEDLCQALGKLYIEKYQQEGGPGVVDAMALIDDASTAPARDRPQLWLALVFNVLIGNCDAHGKNYSLLYDSRAPSLAPLYDLVSTATYDELTTRLAMSIDGARRLESIERGAWLRLAEEVGFAPRFLEQRMAPFVDRVLGAVPELASEPQHSDPIVREIAVGISERALRLRPN